MVQVNVDQGGDVEMTVAQPVFEFIKTPRVTVWSQPALVRFLRDRRHYEEKIWERCMTTGEAHDHVLVSIKSFIHPRILDHLANYVFKTEVFALSEERLREEIARKAGTLLNDHVPDVERLFQEEMKMEMREGDIQARVNGSFMEFDRLVEEHGLAEWVGRGSVTDAEGQ